MNFRIENFTFDEAMQTITEKNLSDLRTNGKKQQYRFLNRIFSFLYSQFQNFGHGFAIFAFFSCFLHDQLKLLMKKIRKIKNIKRKMWYFS